MVQFYFLAICLNLVGGSILAAPYFQDRFPIIFKLRETLYSRTALRIGLISSLLIVGILKIISVFIGDVLIVGDLLPALALLTSGFTLSIEYISENNETGKGLIHKMDSIFVKHSSIVGVAAIVAGTLHFIFPGVLFL
ncbi:MAG: hypothetical protein PF693_18155 [Spirochaetia bacterium]|jgi:hypothetical protein|nr:hypothetical protein [Spirochaetia bacterium]